MLDLRKKTAVDRNSNGELLRILAMFLIVLSHFSTHGTINIYEYVEDGNLSLLYLQILSMGGNIGVNTFILLTGYYLFYGKFKTKKLIQTVLQVTIYSISCYVIFHINGGLSAVGIVKSVFSVLYGEYWFMTGYVGLYLFFPYLNKLLRSLEKDEYQKFMFLLFITVAFIPFAFKTQFILSDFMWFVFIYTAGAYLRKYGFPSWLVKYGRILNIALLAVIVGIVVVLHLLGNIDPRIRCHATFFNAKESPFIIAFVISLFVNAQTMRLQSNVINWIGGCTMGVYLFHENPNVRQWLWSRVNNLQFYDHPWKLIVSSILCSVAVFLIGVVCDYLVTKLVNIVLKFWKS